MDPPLTHGQLARAAASRWHRGRGASPRRGRRGGASMRCSRAGRSPTSATCVQIKVNENRTGSQNLCSSGTGVSPAKAGSVKPSGGGRRKVAGAAGWQRITTARGTSLAHNRAAHPGVEWRNQIRSCLVQTAAVLRTSDTRSAAVPPHAAGLARHLAPVDEHHSLPQLIRGRELSEVYAQPNAGMAAGGGDGRAKPRWLRGSVV